MEKRTVTKNLIFGFVESLVPISSETVILRWIWISWHEIDINVHCTELAAGSGEEEKVVVITIYSMSIQ